MMVLGLVSDVHSNLPALVAVLEDMEERGVERIISAGDVVGYNPFPNRVIELFKKRDIVSVMGNHDWAIVNDDYSRLNRLSGVTDPWTRERLTQANMVWLARLPESLYLEVEEVSVRVFHGGPEHINQRIYPETWTSDDMEGIDARLLMVGHTHHPWVKRFGDRGIFNPGSAGQPRDGNPKASFGLLEIDGERWAFENVRIPYDIDTVKYRYIEEGLPIDGFARLYEGN